MIDRKQAIVEAMDAGFPTLSWIAAEHIVDAIFALPDPVHEAARECDEFLTNLIAGKYFGGGWADKINAAAIEAHAPSVPLWPPR